MDTPDVEALQRRVDTLCRTHLGALAAGPLDRDPIVGRQYETLTPEGRAHLSARVAYVTRKLTGG
jgi:hypothetical protein